MNVVDAPSSASGAPKCAKLAGALSKAAEGSEGRVDLSLTGSKDSNALVALLKCDAKALRGSLSACPDLVKNYDKCHASVMGAGMFEGRRGCAEELRKLMVCVHQKPTE